jgi:hypothetical protein
MNELDFSGKQILVVGGSSGIGNGIGRWWAHFVKSVFERSEHRFAPGKPIKLRPLSCRNRNGSHRLHLLRIISQE